MEIKNMKRERRVKIIKEEPVDKEIIHNMNEIIFDVEKKFGKGTIMNFNNNSKIEAVPVISSGILGLDLALGVKGLPKGRIIEIFGPESSGKTTLALHVIAEAQKLGGISAFIDAEHALDIAYAKRIGVNLDDLLISQPDDGEQALEICDMLIKKPGINVIVVDSVAALVPRAEINGEMGDSHMGLHARLMSQAMRKLTKNVSNADCVLIFINQTRSKIGVVFGSPETTTGGNALKFYASVRIDIRKIGQIKEGDKIIGNKTKIKIIKNKVAPPFKEIELIMSFGDGLSKIDSIIDLALKANILERSGSWYSYGTNRIGQGSDNVVKYLKEHNKILENIKNEIIQLYDKGELNV